MQSLVVSVYLVEESRKLSRVATGRIGCVAVDENCRKFRGEAECIIWFASIVLQVDKMALAGCYACLKYLMFVFNFIFWVNVACLFCGMQIIARQEKLRKAMVLCEVCGFAPCYEDRSAIKLFRNENPWNANKRDMVQRFEVPSLLRLCWLVMRRASGHLVPVVFCRNCRKQGMAGKARFTLEGSG